MLLLFKDGLGGFDQSEMLMGDGGSPSSRQEMVYNIQTTQDLIGTSGAIRFENWKLLVNQGLLENFLLFNLDEDPNKTENLISEFPEIFHQLLEKYKYNVSRKLRT
jgi:hypothetical protein